jgi:hypothetical protein
MPSKKDEGGTTVPRKMTPERRISLACADLDRAANHMSELRKHHLREGDQEAATKFDGAMVRILSERQFLLAAAVNPAVAIPPFAPVQN